MRAQTLRNDAESLAGRLDSAERRCRRLEATLRELAPIISDAAIVGGERLGPLREAASERLLQMRDERRELELEQSRAVAACDALEPRVSALRALLVDAFLLDGRDHGEAYAELAAGIAEGEAAKRELTRVGDAKKTLEATLPALRFPPSALGAPRHYFRRLRCILLGLPRSGRAGRT